MIIDLLPGIFCVPGRRANRVRSVWTFQYRPVDVPYAYMCEVMRLAHPNPQSDDARRAQPDRSVLLALGSFPDDDSAKTWYASLVVATRERRVYRAVVSLEIPGVLMVRAVAQDACVLPIPRIAIDVLAGRPIRDPRTPLLPSDTKRLHVIRHERPVLDDTYLPFWEWMTRRHERVTALRHWFPTVPYEDAGYYEKCVETDE